MFLISLNLELFTVLFYYKVQLLRAFRHYPVPVLYQNEVKSAEEPMLRKESVKRKVKRSIQIHFCEFYMLCNRIRTDESNSSLLDGKIKLLYSLQNYNKNLLLSTM